MADSKPRVYLWDNVKALLIILVVMGHFITQFTGSNEIMQSMFSIIYSVHMPLFIFVSGLFTRYKNGKLQVNKIISYLILYVLLKLIIFIERVSFGHNSKFDLFSDAGIPWYMLAMAAWLCMTYCFRNVKPLPMMIVSVVSALLVGYANGIGDVLCLSRIIVFYPFFLLGYYLDANKIIEKTRKPWMKIVAVVLLLTLVVLAFTCRGALYSLRPVLVGRNSYAKFAVPSLGPVFRLGWYIVSTILSAAIVCLIPNKQNKLSYIGAATLPIYFIHRPILYILMDVGFGALVVNGLGPIWGPIVFLLSAILLAFILSWPPFSKPFNKLMKVQYTKLFKGEE
ncbi:MAG: acyltransferase family protein [Clostridia bacterium]|nr:acyltransferase family protein [Clostridia bacterium]